MNTVFPLQRETMAAFHEIPAKSVARQSATLGVSGNEPLLLAMDGLIRYAKAYRLRYDSALADDGVLGPSWLDTAKGLRALLNGDGVVAMERGIATDSKDNGMIETMFWHAVRLAGFSESDI